MCVTTGAQHRAPRDAKHRCRIEDMERTMEEQESTHRGVQYEHLPGLADGPFQGPFSATLRSGGVPHHSGQ